MKQRGAAPADILSNAPQRLYKYSKRLAIIRNYATRTQTCHIADGHPLGGTYGQIHHSSTYADIRHYAYIGQTSLAHAQQATIKRTDLAKADQSATDVGALWIADIPAGGATGRHTHPTPRFVYVLEGSVILEMDGKPPQNFKAGEAFVELPEMVHNFRNASATDPAKALGFQIAPKGAPLQTNVQ